MQVTTYSATDKVGTATTTSYNDTGLTAGKEYDYYVIAFDSSGNQSNASATIKVKTKAEPVGEKSTIAAWGFVDNGEHGTIMATDGAYKAASTFKAIGGPFFEYISTGDNTLSYWGWDGADYGSKYWLATVPTTGFKNITLSSSTIHRVQVLVILKCKLVQMEKPGMIYRMVILQWLLPVTIVQTTLVKRRML